MTARLRSRAQSERGDLCSLNWFSVRVQNLNAYLYTRDLRRFVVTCLLSLRENRTGCKCDGKNCRCLHESCGDHRLTPPPCLCRDCAFQLVALVAQWSVEPADWNGPKSRRDSTRLSRVSRYPDSSGTETCLINPGIRQSSQTVSGPSSAYRKPPNRPTRKRPQSPHRPDTDATGRCLGGSPGDVG